MNFMLSRVQRLEIQFCCCLTTAVIVYSMMMVTIMYDWSNGRVISDSSVNPVSELRTGSSPQSRHTKSNMFMLKDAFCNFSNGDLVCHRAVGLRRNSKRSGS